MDNNMLLNHTEEVNELLARYGVKFGIYKNGTFKEEELVAPIEGTVGFIHNETLAYQNTAVIKLIP